MDVADRDYASALAQRLLRLVDDLQRNDGDPQLVCLRVESVYTDAIELDAHGALIPAEVMAKLRESVIILTQHTTSLALHPGRPAFDITAEQLEHLLELGFSATTIADLLGVSRSTVCRRMRDFGLSCSTRYCCISDETLDDVVRAICQEFPGCGAKMLQGHLMERGVVVQQRRVRDTLRRTDPEGVLMRQRLGIRRRQYNVAAPLELWHIDGNHKLIR